MRKRQSPLSHFATTGSTGEAEIARRAARAAGSIVENESLTSDLDDATAGPLLDWGVACARAIAADTAGLDDAQAGEAMAPRLRALRQAMRAVSQWVADRQNMAPASRDALLAQIIEQAAPIYGARFTPPTDAQRAAFLQQLEPLGEPSQMVASLRGLLEGHDYAFAVEDQLA